MKPKFDISAKQSFTVWESGTWQDKKGIGTSIIVADAQSERLQVIYDTDPTRTDRHALFYANPGNVLAECFVKREGNGRHMTLNFHIDLVRIDSMTTLNTQGKAVPSAQTQVLYMSRKVVPYETGTKLTAVLLADMPEFPNLPNAKEMMELAIEKAMTPNAQQKVFYGIPRTPSEE